MEQPTSNLRFVIPRSRQDRRLAQHAAPPYLTEEGLVLVDRREGRDRRAGGKSADHDAGVERMKRLAAFYGYLPAVGGEDVNNPLHPSFAGFTTKLADAA